MTGSFALEDLTDIIRARSGGDAEASYTKSLLDKGPIRVAKKFGEEAVELVIAATEAAAQGATQGAMQPVVAETADVFYHMLVLLESLGVPLADVLTELQRRTAQSGLAEKAGRGGE